MTEQERQEGIELLQKAAEIFSETIVFPSIKACIWHAKQLNTTEDERGTVQNQEPS